MPITKTPLAKSQQTVEHVLCEEWKKRDWNLVREWVKHGKKGKILTNMYITMSIYEVLDTREIPVKTRFSKERQCFLPLSMDTKVIRVTCYSHKNVHPHFKRNLMSHLNLATHWTEFPCELRSTVVRHRNNMTVFGRSLAHFGQPKHQSNNKKFNDETPQEPSHTIQRNDL